MRIGIYFTDSKSTGGVYQYSLTLLETFKDNKVNNNYVIFNMSPDFPTEDFQLPNWEIVYLVPQQTRKSVAEKSSVPSKKHKSIQRQLNLLILYILETLRLYRLEIFLSRIQAKKRAKKINSYNLDLVFFPQPSEISFLIDAPAIVAIHSLEHRTNPQFPEVSAKGQRQKREYLYKNITRSAYRMLVDAHAREEELFEYYNVPPDRIEIVPYLPPDYLQTNISKKDKEKIKKKYSLPERFIFYPAQFWPHKNHRRLIKALKILKDKGIIIPLVLVGSKKGVWGEYEKIIQLVKECEIENQIYFLGYVSNEEIGVLYSLALALVFPTFFGPTPIPILEGWRMGCPVLFSDIKGCRERSGNAILLCDPLDPYDIAKKIESLWNNESLRKTLIKRGKEKLREWTRDDFIAKINKIVSEFQKEYGK